MEDINGSLSRRGILGVAASVGAGLLAACSDGKTGEPKTSSAAVNTSQLTNLPGSERLRQESKFLEPRSYVKTYTVDASAGVSGSFSTFKECYDAVLADKQKELGVAGMVGAQSNIWDWRLIRVMPGTYDQSASGIPPHTALVGMGSQPSDVKVTIGSDDDAFATTGRSTYVRNMHFSQIGKNADAHAMRDEGQSGDVGLGPKQCRTIVFEDVFFTSAGGAPWGKTAADILSGPGTTIVFNKCTFAAPSQAQVVNLVTNAKDEKNTSQYFMLSCTIVGNSAKSASGSANPTTAFPVGVPDFSEGRKDVFTWMDGTWQIGNATPVGALLAFPLTLDAGTSMKATRAGTEYVVINPGSSGQTKLMAPDGVLAPRNDVPSDVQLPLGGISEQEKEFFGRRPGVRDAVIEGSKGSSTIDVSAGQTY